MSRLLSTSTLVAAFVTLTLLVAPCDAQKNPKKWAGVWTDPADSTLPADFKFQGEYAGATKDGDKLGVQVIALDKGAFQAVVYPGGLPGAGWDGKNKSLMDGKLDGDKVTFEPAKDGKRRYKGRTAAEFSATSKFPPMGHKEISGKIEGEVLSGKMGETTFEAKKTTRVSPSMGAKAPEGAVVLFDGTSKDEWNGGRLDEMTKLLNTDGNDIVSKKKFGNYTVHLEFLLPYRPSGRDQERGNSGFYQADLYEVQILDSFGLDGKNNECGGLYSKKDSDLNMCLPPLTWQTYDIDFASAVRDDSGKITKKATVTVKLNGVVIHDKVEINGPTGGGRDAKAEGTPGPIKLQGHGNPLQFRNIWIVEKK
jgi:hypothetical protein